MTLSALGTLETAAKVQCLCTLVRGESLHQFDLLSANMGDTDSLTVEAIVLGLGA